MFLKSTKQAFAKIGSSRHTLLGRAVTNAQLFSPMVKPNSMSFMNIMRARVPRQIMGSVERRLFSLPDHIVLEMPNLSPTMEKVSVRIDRILSDSFCG